jgi:Domain of unknown function (DUF4157)
MSEERLGRRWGHGDGQDGEAAPAPGRATRVARRHGGNGGGGDAPTIHDVATVAVEQKTAGRAVDGDVAGKVGSHLGHDFSSVRVHDDPLAREATAAMGARAFAYGGDVFLGPGESDGDLGLMAHELTHVAQQGAAAQTVPQRQVTVGASDSPAEHQADAVAAAVTGGARPQALLVDDGAVQPGQMLKSAFLDQLRGAITAAADQELGPVFSAVGCPYIDQYFARYSGQPAAAGEALLRRYAPGAGGVTSAAAMIPIVVARVREGIRAWKETGAAPDVPGGAAVPAGGPMAAAMGAAQPMDAGTASRMTDELGDDVAGAQIHLGPEAQAFAARHDALAVTVGPHVAFAPGAYQPGTIAGDALLAHELGHVAQQKGAAMPSADAIPDAGAALEADADRSAAGALARLYGGARSAARKAGEYMKSGVSMARCAGSMPQVNTGGAGALDFSRVPAGPAREAAVAMQAATAPIEQNTARQLADGTITAYYIEDLAHAADEATILASQRPPLDPASWMILVHPRNSANMIVQRNAQGFQPDAYRGDIFGLRSVSAERWRTVLIHETNHARNAAPANILERYRSEFRAYWVAEFSTVADLADRARQIKAHILRDYPAIRAAYDGDPATKTAIDGITTPDGNLDNH